METHLQDIVAEWFQLGRTILALQAKRVTLVAVAVIPREATEIDVVVALVTTGAIAAIDQTITAYTPVVADLGVHAVGTECVILDWNLTLLYAVDQRHNVTHNFFFVAGQVFSSVFWRGLGHLVLVLLLLLLGGSWLNDCTGQ